MVVEPDKHRRQRIPALNIKFIILICLSFLLLITDQKNNYLSLLRNSIAIAIHPIQAIVDLPQRLWRWTGENLASREDLLIENKKLYQEQLYKELTLQRYASLEQENIRLRKILNAASNIKNSVQIARIISVDINPFRHLVIINKGEQDSVYNGQVLVDANGVIGQILQTNFLSSKAILISDTDHATPVEINRNGFRMIAQGNGSFTHLVIPFVPNNTDIKVGDLMVTSGLGGKFPAGYPVAIIDSISRDPSQQFANVTARPIASLNQVREVILININ